MADLAKDRKRAKGDFIELSDGVVHYELSGPKTGSLVVLVHGFSTPYFGWNGIIKPLHRAGLRVLRYDLFGRGWSDRPWTKYDLDLYDKQLVELLAKLCLLEPLSLVGWSMGGIITSTYAVRHPENVKALALLAPAGLPVRLPALARLVHPPLFGEALMLSFGHRVLLGMQKKLFADRSHLRPFLERFGEQLRYPGIRRALLSTLRHMPLEAHQEVYGEIGRRGLPTLLLWGDEDRVCPFDNHQSLMRLIPQAQFFAIEGSAHGLAMERPMAVSERLGAFLTALS